MQSYARGLCLSSSRGVILGSPGLWWSGLQSFKVETPTACDSVFSVLAWTHGCSCLKLTDHVAMHVRAQVWMWVCVPFLVRTHLAVELLGHGHWVSVTTTRLQHPCVATVPWGGGNWWAERPQQKLSCHSPHPSHGRAWPMACPGGSTPQCLSDLREAREGREWAEGKGAGQNSGESTSGVCPRESCGDMSDQDARCCCRCLSARDRHCAPGTLLPLSRFGNVGLRKTIPAARKPLARENCGAHPRLAQGVC